MWALSRASNPLKGRTSIIRNFQNSYPKAQVASRSLYDTASNGHSHINKSDKCTCLKNSHCVVHGYAKFSMGWCGFSSQAVSKNSDSKALAGLRRIDLEGLRWRVFDAKGQVLGRLASQISTVIQGKDKPTYAPNRDDGDMCVVINAKDICVTGRKLTDKYYRWHTGYIGHLKERSLKDQMAKDPGEVIRKAVMRMLPRNKLRDDRDRKLRIFAASEHPFGDRPVEAYVMPPRKVRELRPRDRRAMIRAQKKAEQQSQGETNYKRGKKREEDNNQPEISA